MKNKKIVGKQLRETYHIVGRFIENRMKENFEKEEEKVTRVQIWIIGYLCDNAEKNIFQKDIEKEFKMGRSSVTETLQLMEKNGFIERVPVEEDARLKKIVITEKTKKIHKKIIDNINHTESMICKGISKEEMDRFFDTLEKIRNNCL